MSRSFVVGLSLLASVGSACTGFKDDSELDSSESGLAIPYVPGNPSCQDLGYAYEAKVNSPPAGQSTVTAIGGAVITFTRSADGFSVSWTSPDLPLDAVLMKAADGAYVYAYTPEATFGNNLQTPHTQGNDPEAPQAGLSHISFCYDLEVVVTKTASTSFTRDHDWTVQKTAATTDVVLSLNQYFLLAFQVVVTPAGSTDSAWAVGGTITVRNPDPNNTAELQSVTDTMSGTNVAVNCGEGVTFPYTLAKAGAAGDTLVCSYATGVSDGSNRENTATATTTQGSLVGSGSHTVPVEFSDTKSTISTVDGCVTVTDTHQGSLGEVCAEDGSTTFSYNVPLQFAVCGPSQLTNTASINDDGQVQSSTVVVDIDVPCVSGCTLTQGYWKTHSSYGPAPHDEDGWAGHENDIFFLSGMTQYQVLWTAPAGNAYFVLAHQYIAAARNMANGASVPASVQAAFDQATTLFGSYTPAQVKAMKNNNAVKQQFISLAFALDQYNNGITGPGHCSE